MLITNFMIHTYYSLKFYIYLSSLIPYSKNVDPNKVYFYIKLDSINKTALQGGLIFIRKVTLIILVTK